MAAVVLIIFGITAWLVIRNANQRSKQITHYHENQADKDFEDMYFNGASGNDIDDF